MGLALSQLKSGIRVKYTDEETIFTLIGPHPTSRSDWLSVRPDQFGWPCRPGDKKVEDILRNAGLDPADYADNRLYWVYVEDSHLSLVDEIKISVNIAAPRIWTDLRCLTCNEPNPHAEPNLSRDRYQCYSCRSVGRRVPA